jgi:hypothetical protein
LDSERRGRRNRRAHDLRASRPLLSLVGAFAVMTWVIAVCGDQLSQGTYLGRDWLIAALAGMATAAGLGAAVLVLIRRHSPATSPVAMAELVLIVASTLSPRIPFPRGPYGGVQAFFNVAHAALLGYGAVTLAGIAVLVAYLRLRSADHAPKAVPATPSPPLPARLRFPGAKPARWRPGQLLVAANGTVTWLSWKGDAEVDLTSACQALPTRPAHARGRRPRKTTLVTPSGLAEVEVSPIALALLIRDSQRPPYEETTGETAQD